MSQIIKMYIY